MGRKVCNLAACKGLARRERLAPVQRQRESKLQPGETEVASLNRYLMALEEPI